MVFVDTNVFIYAVGRPHPLQERSRALLASGRRTGQEPLVTSAEVLQELLHRYLPKRLREFDAAIQLLRNAEEIWATDPDDVALARSLAGAHPQLEARDLVHLACCRRRGVNRIHTFDRRLAAAVRKGRP